MPRPYLRSPPAIRHHLQGASFEPQKTGDVYPSHHGLFVTLWKKDGGLRGCIGHTHKSSQPLDADVMQYAISAATQDPRFPPVTVDELDDLKMELSVLTPSEKISDRSQLDPKEYGIIVAAGLKRGVLLPEVQGVETVEQQIEITCRKANISSHEQMEIYRFRSIKFKEVS